MTMPQTRHYEMKDSGVEWIGKMPSHWSASPFKKIIAQNDGGVWGEDPIDNDGAVVLRSTEQTVDGKWNIEQPAKRDLSHVAKLRYYKLEIGDLLITKSSGSALHIGKTSIVDADIAKLHCYYSNFMQRVRLKQNVMPKLYWYILNSSIARYQFVFLQNSTSGIGNINSKHIDNIIVPVPPLAEQAAIAAYLDEKCATIDAIIAEAKASIEEYKSWKASVIFETVTKGLNPNAEMKDSGVEWIGEIPGGWAVERLKAMFSFGKGLPITKEDLVEQGIPVISYGQIHAKFNTGVEVLPQLLRYVDAKWLESNANSLVSEGDFIFADTSEDMEGCGNCVYVDTLNEGAQLFAGYHTITFKPKRSKHNKFLAYLFKSDAWRTQLRSRVGGVKLFSISRRMLNLATVILPPQNEQTAIVAYLDSKCAAIDGIILEKEELIRELETYKRSLIFEVVTGKRRVC